MLKSLFSSGFKRKLAPEGERIITLQPFLLPALVVVATVPHPAFGEVRHVG